MARAHYERLSAQDNTFLLFETPNVHMHVAATQIFRAGPLKTRNGGIDVGRIRRRLASLMHRIPRYRQKLGWIPLQQHAVWVDDPHFHLDYHIRHTSLPRPGTAEQLKHLSARVMAQQLDRARPLWECWIVEGLEGDRFAMIHKMHHCMIDGASGMDLAHILLSLTPEPETPAPAPLYLPRPAPGGLELLRDEYLRRMSLPLKAVQSIRTFRRETENVATEVSTRLRAVRDMLGWAVRSPSKTPLNGKIGPHRCFDWLQVPLEDIKSIRRTLDCTVNDVVLTVVTGAVRDFLQQRQVHPEEVDFRISAPVSVRKDDERGQMGNRVSSWIVRLPLDESEPMAQLDAIRKITQELKASRQALGVQMIMAMAEWTPSSLLSLGAQSVSGPINTIVTNVPGPQFPLYLLGSELLEMYPQVPLMENLGLGIALVSYNGNVCWGFNADRDLLPDLDRFVAAIKRALARVALAAGAKVSDDVAAAA